jgi:TPR repeat protein
VEAALALGRLHERGVGLPPYNAPGNPNHKEAARWYQVAAVEGHAEAMNNLGALYHSG